MTLSSNSNRSSVNVNPLCNCKLLARYKIVWPKFNVQTCLSFLDGAHNMQGTQNQYNQIKTCINQLNRYLYRYGHFSWEKLELWIAACIFYFYSLKWNSIKEWQICFFSNVNLLLVPWHWDYITCFSTHFQFIERKKKKLYQILFMGKYIFINFVMFVKSVWDVLIATCRDDKIVIHNSLYLEIKYFLVMKQHSIF